MCNHENKLIIWKGKQYSKGLKNCVTFIYLNFDLFLEKYFHLLMTRKTEFLQSFYSVQSNTKQKVLLNLQYKENESQIIVICISYIWHSSFYLMAVMTQSNC